MGDDKAIAIRAKVKACCTFSFILGEVFFQLTCFTRFRYRREDGDGGFVLLEMAANETGKTFANLSDHAIPFARFHLRKRVRALE